MKIAIGIKYNGSNYSGWQKQEKRINSVQQRLEFALSKIANHMVHVFCAGRTDVGVHAIGQVVHFETDTKRKNLSWIYGANSFLPRDIAVQWTKEVPNNFHARLSALSRRYFYVIYNHHIRPVILHKLVSHVSIPLNVEKMQRAATFLIGEKDFSSFRAYHCQSKTPWRNIMHINIKRCANYILIDIKANSFLYRMVRNIVGSLIQIGCNRKKENWIKDLLNAKNRNFASDTAKPDGLYLVAVQYPHFFYLPCNHE